MILVSDASVNTPFVLLYSLFHSCGIVFHTVKYISHTVVFVSHSVKQRICYWRITFFRREISVFV